MCKHKALSSIPSTAEKQGLLLVQLYINIVLLSSLSLDLESEAMSKKVNTDQGRHRVTFSKAGNMSLRLF
jgi:hypothetical protein